MKRVSLPSFRCRRAFTLIECVLAVGVCSVVALATLSGLSFARTKNELEQERTRAHQIVTQWLEVNRFQLFTWTSTEAPQVLWSNNSGAAQDDTNGTLEVVVTNPLDGSTVTSSTMPNPAVMVQIEATLTWHPRGMNSNRTLRETVMTYKAP
jgi:type II secretory pathway pseudopilin PulG